MSVLLQTRVENRVAQDFKRAARNHGKSPNAYLQHLVEQALTSPNNRPSGLSRKRSARRRSHGLPANLVARLRMEEDD